MRTSLLLLFIFASVIVSAQANTEQVFRVKKPTKATKRTPTYDDGILLETNKCVLIIGGEAIDGGATLTKEQLLKLCTLQVRYDSKQTLQPISYRWIISHKPDDVFQGTYPEKCRLLAAQIAKMVSGDVIFIEDIKFKEGNIYCTAQHMLILK